MLIRFRICLYAVLCLIGLAGATPTFAGGQIEEPLSNSVKAMMQKSISDSASPRLFFATEIEGRVWMDDMSERLKARMPNKSVREDFLRTVHYEASRAGLDPQLVLGLIQVESGLDRKSVV